MQAPTERSETTPPALLRLESNVVTCTLCGRTGPTLLEHKTGKLTWLTSVMVCMMGGWAGCCAIPFCMDAFQDTAHRCSSCRNTLAVYKKI